jgi:hypothetical protein
MTAGMPKFFKTITFGLVLNLKRMDPKVSMSQYALGDYQASSKSLVGNME